MQRCKIKDDGEQAAYGQLKQDRHAREGAEIPRQSSQRGNQQVGHVVFLLGPPGEPQDFAGEVGIDDYGQVAVDGTGPADGFHADGGSIEQHGYGNCFLDDFEPEEEV